MLRSGRQAGGLKASGRQICPLVEPAVYDMFLRCCRPGEMVEIWATASASLPVRLGKQIDNHLRRLPAHSHGVNEHVFIKVDNRRAIVKVPPLKKQQ